MQAEPLTSLEGDFALGIRAVAIDAQASIPRGDFATGMRTRPSAFATGTFATGQATTEMSTVRGHFATGQGSRSPHIRSQHPRLHRHEHGPSTIGEPATETRLS